MSSDSGASSSVHLVDAANIVAGNHVDDLVHLAVGATPALLAERYVNSLPSSSSLAIQQFNSLCIVSAAANKRAVSEALARPNMRECMTYIMTHWMIRKDFNNSAMNLIGHMLLTTDYLNTNKLAAAYRNRLGGTSIWHVNIDASKLSDAQKEIIKEKLTLVNREEAFAAGAIIGRAACEKIYVPPPVPPPPQVPTPPSTAVPEESPMEMDTRKRKQVAAGEISSSHVPSPGRFQVSYHELPDKFKKSIEDIRARELRLQKVNPEEVAIHTTKIAQLRNNLTTELMKLYGKEVEVVMIPPPAKKG